MKLLNMRGNSNMLFYGRDRVKKIITLVAAGIMIFAFSTNAFAASAVSQMAVTKGGQHVAECAQDMDKGVSECAKMPVCQDLNQ
jgi:hypothetical protein